MQNQIDSEQSLIKSSQYQQEGSNLISPSINQYNQSQKFNMYVNCKEKLPSNIADIDQPDDIITILEKTFKRGQIYIDLGYKNLISLNPFEQTLHLSDSSIQSYKKDFLNKSNPKLNQSPHLYKLAELAKQACFSSQNIYNTCSILTQGISGSGKTVASKGILDYIAAESKSGLYISTTLNKVEIEKRIIATNIIFEAFGNAKTKKNSNSSRFGKVVQIQFEKNQKISSGKIITTLFERTRLTQNRYNDRNYHIFYQLQTAYNKIEDLKTFIAQQLEEEVEYETAKLVQEIQKLSLDSEFILLGNQNSMNSSWDDQSNKFEEDLVQANEDFENFKQLLLAFNALNFSLEEIVNIFQCIAGLIHLREDNYEKAQELLQIPNLKQTINEKITTVTRQSKKIQAESIINGIIMDFYFKLFCWIQDRINSDLSQDYDVNKKYTLNVFDSFGFEVFENEYGIQQNQFEQLMLNYINEKLQNLFYFQIVDDAQKKFQSENLTLVPVDFQQNDKIIKVMEDVIFNNIKDCNLLSRSTKNLKEVIIKQINEKNFKDVLIDETQLKKKQGSLTQSQNTHKFEQNIIGIRHTGGEVYYQLEGFLSSNRYSVSQDIQNISQTSKNQIIKSFTLQSENQTVADNTQKVINDIIQMFKKSETWFVKCFQTNYQQKPQNFDKVAMKAQLSQSGIEQCAQLLYQTYLLSIPKEEFFKSYSIIVPNIQSMEEDLKVALNQQVKQSFSKTSIQAFHFGSNNILIKDKLKIDLDQKRENIIKSQDDQPYQSQLKMCNEVMENMKQEHGKQIQDKNKALQNKEKEAQYQQKRANYLEASQKEMISIIEQLQNYYSEQMEKLYLINQNCINNIEALKNQTEENDQNIESQDNQNIQVFGQIQ